MSKCLLRVPWLLVLLLVACQFPTATPPTATTTMSATATPPVAASTVSSAATPPLAATNLPPTATPLTGPTSGAPTPSPSAALGSCLTVTPASQTLPAGSSAQFSLQVGAPCDAVHYTFRADELPVGWAAEFLGSPMPWVDTLTLTAAGTARPGRYRIRVTATSDAAMSTSAELELEVVPCVEFQAGEFTQAINSNLVTLITAGKPSIEHGLLVPLQVCDGQAGRRLLVTLAEVISEAGSAMTTPPRFYLYRSRVWPEPASITAHVAGSPLNVQLPRINSEGWQLRADLVPGLYLLVFERDYWGSSPDPNAIPAAVTYRLSLLP